MDGDGGPDLPLMFVALALVLLLLNKPEIRRIEGVEEYVAEQRAEMGPLVPGGEEHADRVRHHGHAVDLPRHRRAGRGYRLRHYSGQRPARRGHGRRVRRVVALPAATDWQKREFTLRWRDAAEIDWGTIVLFGTGIIFGWLLADTGLAKTIGNGARTRWA